MKLGQFKQAWELYPKLPMDRVSHLPEDGFDWMEVNLLSRGYAYFPLKCLARNVHGAKSHRLIAKCRCGREVPFGRMGQHRKACKPLMRCTQI